MVRVNIFGTDYRVHGDAPEDYVQEIAAYVDATMKAIAGDGRHISPSRIAVLAAFNIADELFRAKREEGGGEQVEARAARLLELFDDDELDANAASAGGDGAC
jgi:cell division protein ZapA